VDADRIAQRPRTTARKIPDSARLGYADRRRIEEHEIGERAEGDAAPVENAVAIGRMAGKAPHAIGEAEIAAFAHPVREEMKAETGIAEIDEMRAGIGEGDATSSAFPCVVRRIRR
jgi:hypothetical protein